MLPDFAPQAGGISRAFFPKEEPRPTPYPSTTTEKAHVLYSMMDSLGPRVCGAVQRQHDASLECRVMRALIPSQGGTAENFPGRAVSPDFQRRMMSLRLNEVLMGPGKAIILLQVDVTIRLLSGIRHDLSNAKRIAAPKDKESTPTAINISGCFHDA
ncbi:hypothetical protein BDZ45DRAFT_737764 [Acephala macrosclerotiorum]|nr:hypothetical protein BDZ45DRAFT_737764 [Acephala macrosclerotiorum]